MRMCMQEKKGEAVTLPLHSNNYRVKPASTYEPSQIAIDHLGEGHLPRVLVVLCNLPLKVTLMRLIESILCQNLSDSITHPLHIALVLLMVEHLTQLVYLHTSI